MRSWSRALLAVGFVAALALTVIFAIRTVQHARPLRQRADPPIQGWMTIRFIAHSYHVPAAPLYQALGLQQVRGDRQVLSAIAQQQGRTVADEAALLRRAIQQERSSPARAAPRPTPAPTATP